jgi:hypothetical protein
MTLPLTSRLPPPTSLPLSTPHSPFPIPHSPLVTRHFPLVTRHFPCTHKGEHAGSPLQNSFHPPSLVTLHFPLPTSHLSLVTRHSSRPTTHLSPVTRHPSLPTSYHYCPTINQINSIGYGYRSLKSCRQNS